MRPRLRSAKASLRPPRVPERVEQAHIVQLLRSVGGQVYVMGTVRRRGDYGGTMQTEGIPDLMAFLPGRPSVGLALSRRVFLFIECKAKGGRVRPEQALFRERCLEADVSHIVGDLDQVIAWLVARGYLAATSVPHYRQPPETSS